MTTTTIKRISEDKPTGQLANNVASIHQSPITYRGKIKSKKTTGAIDKLANAKEYFASLFEETNNLDYATALLCHSIFLPEEKEEEEEKEELQELQTEATRLSKKALQVIELCELGINNLTKTQKILLWSSCGIVLGYEYYKKSKVGSIGIGTLANPLSYIASAHKKSEQILLNNRRHTQAIIEDETRINENIKVIISEENFTKDEDEKADIKGLSLSLKEIENKATTSPKTNLYWQADKSYLVSIGSEYLSTEEVRDIQEGIETQKHNEIEKEKLDTNKKIIWLTNKIDNIKKNIVTRKKIALIMKKNLSTEETKREIEMIRKSKKEIKNNKTLERLQAKRRWLSSLDKDSVGNWEQDGIEKRAISMQKPERYATRRECEKIIEQAKEIKEIIVLRKLQGEVKERGMRKIEELKKRYTELMAI